MLLKISTTHQPATDLGHLLRKHPERVHSFELSFGTGHVFYPEATDERCTAVLLLDIDPVGLVRGRSTAQKDGGLLDQYVNDRPYVASSFMSVAISRVFGSALGGNTKDHAELADTAIPLEIEIPVISSRGGEQLLRELFEPLGFHVTATPLDDPVHCNGRAVYFTLGLTAEKRVRDALAHLYVLVPVLDDDKHYYVSHEEVQKLLHKGGEWLATHPKKDLIVRRYLAHKRHLMTAALEQLLQEEASGVDEREERNAAEEERVERDLSLNQQRIGAVTAALKSLNARRVIDLGCGEGRLLRELIRDRSFTEIVGMDVAHRTLEIASSRLKLDRMSPRDRARINLFHGSLMYRDDRLAGYDAATVVEVIEHLDPPRLRAFERVLFENAKPAAVVLATPNVEYNVLFETLPAGTFRHKDHRFEWSRQQFREWAESVCERFGYAVQFVPIGPDHPEHGSPTQMAVFTR